jgi:protein ImuB
MLARSLFTRVGALGMTACVAVSGNFYAAVAVAKGPLPLSVRVIPTGEESTALAALPLTVLDLTETQAETFALWGFIRWGCWPLCRRKS